MIRIYDDPNHPTYGPVRRAWVMLVGMFGTDLSEVDRAFYQEWGFNWDEHLHLMMREQGYPERYALQRLIWKALACYEDQIC